MCVRACACVEKVLREWLSKSLNEFLIVFDQYPNVTKNLVPLGDLGSGNIVREVQIPGKTFDKRLKAII